MTTATLSWPRELVLPSGGFARVRRLTGRDFLRLPQSPGAEWEPALRMLALMTELDGVQLTYAAVLELDYQDIMALMAHLKDATAGPVPA